MTFDAEKNVREWKRIRGESLEEFYTRLKSLPQKEQDQHKEDIANEKLRLKAEKVYEIRQAQKRKEDIQKIMQELRTEEKNQP